MAYIQLSVCLVKALLLKYKCIVIDIVIVILFFFPNTVHKYVMQQYSIFFLAKIKNLQIFFKNIPQIKVSGA